MAGLSWRRRSAWPARATASYTFLDSQNQKDDPRYYLKALLPPRASGSGSHFGRAVAQARRVLFQSVQYINRTQTLQSPRAGAGQRGPHGLPLEGPTGDVGCGSEERDGRAAQDLDGYLPPRASLSRLVLPWKQNPPKSQPALAQTPPSKTLFEPEPGSRLHRWSFTTRWYLQD